MNVVNYEQTLAWLQSLGLRCCVASFVVMLTTWTAVLFLRNRSAALRHRVLLLGLTGVSLLPALVLVSQNMSPTLRMAMPTPNATSEVQVIEAIGTVQLQERTSGRKPHAFLLADVNDVTLTSPTVQSGPSFVLSEDVEFTSATLPAKNPEWQSQDSSLTLPTVSLSSLLLLVWGLGIVVLVMRALRERILLLRTLRRSIEVTDHRAIAMMRSIAKNHVIREASVLCSESLQVPVAIGVLRTAIVLPVGYGKWSDERLQIVLLHEMMHIGRADVLAQSVARLACTLFWFNPLAWRAASRMRLERELATDDSVLLAGEDAVDYAEHLLEIAAAISPRFRAPAAASAMATHTHLRSRVSRLMQRDIDRSPLSQSVSIVLLLLALVLVTSLTFATPAIAMMPDDSPASAASNTVDSRTEIEISGDLDADWIAKLKAMPNLKKLTIQDPRKNFQASALGQLTGLQSLHVESLPLDAPMADSIMVNIAKINGLRDVTFKATGITSNGLRTIGASSIASLSLIDEERMTDDGFESIAKIPTLEKLYLSGTPIEAPGLEFLLSAKNLKSLALLEDQGATERLPVIARFPSLVDLELFDEAYPNLVVLKKLQSLRHLTLRHCGAFKASESLEQLSQLDRLELDNADIREETFDEVKLRLAKAGIEVVDISQIVAATGQSEPAQAASEATQLARRVHRELNYAKQHPNFWMKWESDSGFVSSMQAERIRTIHLLKKALDSDYSPRPGSVVDLQEIVMAWTPGEWFMYDRHLKNQEIRYEAYKYGDAELAWAREGKADSLKHFPRNGVTAFADSMFNIPAQLEVSHQDFWWGKGLNHRVTTSSVPPEAATYRELQGETFGGEACRVVESPGRSERMWISMETGRLRGILHYIHQGFSTPFHRQPIVTKVIGHEVHSRDEYRTLLATLSKEQRATLSQAWSEYEFDSAIPGKLYEFSDYREIAPQSWFPFEVRMSGWLHNEKSENYYDFHASIARVTEVATNRTDLKSIWEPLLPKEGEKVQDQRFAVPVDYVYKQDRTTAEIEALVNENLFLFAKSEIMFDERRNPLNKLLNKPALELPMKGWLGDQPDLKGKSYLLHFWATWCGPCKNDIPLLNELAKKSIVIGVHPSGTPEDTIRKCIADEKISYPTILSDTGIENPIGYPVSMYPYCIKVDEQGNVVKHGLLQDVLGISAPKQKSKTAMADLEVSGITKAIHAKDALVLFSMGEKHGIESQQKLDVLRDGKRIGQLRVVLVKADQSVGKVDRKEETEQIQVGDKVQRAP
jgi:beta-lactamase regulating signal transducer with metallopeptidase domain/thiol-disulfide isomerase/thioredoxin